MKFFFGLFLVSVIAACSPGQAFGGRDRDKAPLPDQPANQVLTTPAASVPEAVKMMGDAIKLLELTLTAYEFKNNYAIGLLQESQKALSNNGRYTRVESNRSYQKFMATVKTRQDTNAISKFTPAQRKESEERLTSALTLVSRSLKGMQRFRNLKSDLSQSIQLAKESQRQIMECIATR